MGEWKEYKLGEIIKIVAGGTPKTSECRYWNGNIPWLSVVDFNNDRKYVYETEKHISVEGLNNSSTKILSKGDIIISARGTVGAMAMLGKDMAFNQSCYGIQPTKLVDRDYLYYLLFSSIQELKHNSHGGVFDTITRDTFDTIEILLPSLKEQKRIASILSSLDDKIDLLQRENKTLEAMAETLFRKWFIEDAKEEWEEKSLASVSDITAGGDKPKIFSKYITSECTIPVYSNGIDNEGLYGYTNIPKIYKESITVSARGTIGYVVLRRSPYVPIVRLISLIPKDNIVTAKWLYLYLKQLNINGTGTTQQQLTIPDFCSRTIILPPFKIIKKFTNIIDNLYDKQLVNKEEISCIEKMKNCLLKKLMHNK